jgi:hypothetical protein
MMDEQGSKTTAIIVLILVPTATSLLVMMISEVYVDVSLADATAATAANEEHSKIDKASLQLPEKFWNSQQNEQGDCEYLCFNVQNRTR